MISQWLFFRDFIYFYNLYVFNIILDTQTLGVLISVRYQDQIEQLNKIPPFRVNSLLIPNTFYEMIYLGKQRRAPGFYKTLTGVYRSVQCTGVYITCAGVIVVTMVLLCPLSWTPRQTSQELLQSQELQEWLAEKNRMNDHIVQVCSRYGHTARKLL